MTRTIEVTPAQKLAAQRLVARAEQGLGSVDDLIRAIAEAEPEPVAQADADPVHAVLVY